MQFLKLVTQVTNKVFFHTGIVLHKLDYLNRDTFYYNRIKNKINYLKFIENMRIASKNNTTIKILKYI